MKCPKDGSALAKVDVVGIELDKCHLCDGIWFDAGELERIRKMGRDSIEEELEQKYGNPEVIKGDVDGFMRCPRCDDGRLQSHHFSYVVPVRVDRCTDCLGIWLDDTELDALMEDKKQLEKEFSQGRLRLFLSRITNILAKD